MGSAASTSHTSTHTHTHTPCSPRPPSSVEPTRSGPTRPACLRANVPASARIQIMTSNSSHGSFEPGFLIRPPPPLLEREKGSKEYEWLRPYSCSSSPSHLSPWPPRSLPRLSPPSLTSPPPLPTSSYRHPSFIARSACFSGTIHIAFSGTHLPHLACWFPHPSSQPPSFETRTICLPFLSLLPDCII